MNFNAQFDLLSGRSDLDNSFVMDGVEELKFPWDLICVPRFLANKTVFCFIVRLGLLQISLCFA